MSLLPFLRALRRACPHCGAGWRRTGIATLATRCDRCGLRLDRGEGDAFLGSYTIGLFGALVLAVAFAVAGVTIARSLPRYLLYTLAIAAIVSFAIAFQPLAKLLWLAGDLQFRPARDRDFAAEE